MDNIFHYPPDLFDLLVQVIPLLNRSKKSVLLFFKGAGINENLYKDVSEKVHNDSGNINKYEIARTILERINESTDKYLRERRELLKRVTEFEAFSTCWESDQLKAKGLVAEIQRVVNVKDSFTRMNMEREKEVKQRAKEYEEKIRKLQQRKINIEAIKKDLFALFSETNPQKRGKQLENVLNRYFKEFEISIREDFRRVGENGDGIIEQVDGIVEIDNQIYLVEMKWRKDSIGSDDIFAHLGRIYHRANAHGIFISSSGYSPSGIDASKEALTKNALLVLFDLEELVRVIESDIDFKQYVREKIRIAIIDKDPYKKPNL